ncbi:MAG TPA: M48 family metallopeptidase [Enteractinococcus helveticum]|uniref:M48 family metallopeptidase n=1 Tax=Enteractinococcus helveticum TaxID=1837282 RepID=A0A921K760_9MICC|nr:M48 family metallopeptidase [Enteractinococcus helveticum]HJF14405.1 M48 family metallopeptidase [Enteractinococcus helveticum]
MNTISTLVRENIQQLSGGRIASVVEIDGEPIRLIASSRRRKTISASVRDGMIQLSVPMTMKDSEIVSSARSLIAKIKARQRRSNRFQSNPELFARAVYLARVWLQAEVHPTSVVWSDRQTTLWGSCTATTGAIRISTMLRGMPQWVIDGVLVHELAHLKYAGHGQEFQDFTRRYPKMAEADAFLDGVAFAQRRGDDTPFPNAYD